MNNRLNNIFSGTDCLSPEILLAYAENRLTADEKHLVEKHLLDCEFCSDALDGISSLKYKSKLKPTLSEITKKIDSYSKGRKTRVVYFDFRRSMAAAAILIVLIGVTFLFRNYLLKQNREMVAQRTIKESKLEAKEKERINPGTNAMPDQLSESGSGELKASEKNVDKDAAADKMQQQISDNEDIPFLPKSSVVSGEQNQDDQKSFAGYYRGAETATGSTSIKTDVSDNLKSESDEEDMTKDKFVAGNKEETEVQNNTTVVAETKSNTTVAADYKNQPERNEKKENSKQKKNEAPSTAVNNGIALGGVTDQRYSDGVTLYQNTDYSGCLTQLESYLNDVPEDMSANYYCGVSKYFLAQYDSSITYLTKVVKDKKSSFYDTAQWYLSLSYIGKGDNSEAEKILKDIVKAKGTFKTQADEKLLELKEK